MNEKYRKNLEYKKLRYHSNKTKWALIIKARRFKLTPLEWAILRDNQDGRCRICGSEEDLHLDHDHSCCPKKGESCGNCIRQFLCKFCNLGVGYFRDNPDLLIKAADYLRLHGQEEKKKASETLLQEDAIPQEEVDRPTLPLPSLWKADQTKETVE